MNLLQQQSYGSSRRRVLVVCITTILLGILWMVRNKANVVTKVSNAVAAHICDSHGVSESCDCSANDQLDFEAVCKRPDVCWQHFCGNLEANVTARVASGSLRHPPVRLEACLSLQEIPRMAQAAINLLSSSSNPQKPTLPDVCLVATGELFRNEEEEETIPSLVSWEDCQVFVNHHNGEPCECSICQDGASFQFDCGSSVPFSFLAKRCIPLKPPSL